MSSNTYSRTTADGKTSLYSRKGTQGRKSRNLVKWSGYLSKDTLAAIENHVKPLRPYYDVSTVIRDVLDKYVMTELVKH